MHRASDDGSYDMAIRVDGSLIRCGSAVAKHILWERREEGIDIGGRARRTRSTWHTESERWWSTM